MSIMERPVVKELANGGKCWEHRYDEFFMKEYVPATDIDGQVNNYCFRAPLLLVFEEKQMSMEEAVDFAEASGLASIASKNDAGVVFVYPTAEGGWANADVKLYQELIASVKMVPEYHDGIAEWNDFFAREFKGYFIRGAIFRADIYSFGASADYVAKNLLKKVDGEYLWGPGEITPAMCSMERLSVKVIPERKDIGILSVNNSDEINKGFAGCENLLIKEKAEYEADFKSFVRKFKMWCGNMEIEPDFEELGMKEDVGHAVVKTSSDNKGKFKDTSEHKVGYFAYYNEGIFDNGPAPMLLGFHGGGDSSMFFTFVPRWWEVCHDHDFLYVAIENHQDVTAGEVMDVIAHLKERYSVDEHRIYAAGFSMGSGKTWDLYQEYPEVFAGMAPACALFPVKGNPFGKSLEDGINTTVPVPMFYSGGENSPLTELVCQGESGLERIQYAAGTNNLKKKFDYSFDNKDSWKDPVWAEEPDKSVTLHDDERDANLRINYYNSEDGVCRTAFASVSGQLHELRHHTAEESWKFISQFTR